MPLLNPQIRSHLKPGMEVRVVLKKDQPTGKLTFGIIKDILTNQEFHPRGIKVRLTNGKIGRVQEIVSASLSGKKLWDACIECRVCHSITALSQAFKKREVIVNGQVIEDVEYVLEDGQYIVRVGKEDSAELFIANGKIDKTRSKKMGKNR